MRTVSVHGAGTGRGRQARRSEHRRPLRIEALEDRLLLSTIEEFPIPTVGGGPTGIAGGPDGKVWFTEYNASKVGSIDPTTHAIAEYSTLTPGSGPQGITAGPDGKVWFAEELAGKVGVIDPASGSITEYATPTAASGPFGITTGPDGKIWFTEYSASKVGSIDPATHAIVEYHTDDPDSGPQGITSGFEHNASRLWFTMAKIGRLATVDPVTLRIQTFLFYPTGVNGGPPPIPGAQSAPYGIASGPDHRTWVTETAASQVGSTPSGTDNTLTSSFTPTPDSGPRGIVVAPDGKVWYAESAAGKIATVDPFKGAATTEQSVPSAGGSPTGIAVGPDGNIWFTEPAAGTIGLIVTQPSAVETATSLVADFAGGSGSGITRFSVSVSTANGLSPGGVVALDVDGTEAARTVLTADPSAAGRPETGFIDAPVSAAALAAGPHVFRARFLGAAGTVNGTPTAYAPSTSAGVSDVVMPSLTFTPDHPNPGDPVTFTVVVAPAGGGAAGAVGFIVDGTVVGTSPVVDGRAVFTTATIPIGTHTVVGGYDGGGALPPSSSNEVSPVIGVPSTPTSTRLTGPYLLFAGDPLSLTVDVSDEAGRVAGDVRIDQDGTYLRTVHVDGQGPVTFTLQEKGLGAGFHRLTATYQANVKDTGGVLEPLASSSRDFVGYFHPTLFMDPDAAYTFLPVSVIYHVSPDPATGTVTFYEYHGEDAPASVVATVPVAGVGYAYFRTPAIGGMIYFARYSGDATHPPGASNPLTINVPLGTHPTTASLESVPNPSEAGRSVTFTARVEFDYPLVPIYHSPYPYDANGNPLPVYYAPRLIGTGFVTFSVDGVDQPPQPVANPTTFTTSSLGVGTHHVSVRYDGDFRNAPSGTSNTIGQVVVGPTSPPALSAPAGVSVPAGNPVAFRAVATDSDPYATLTFSLGAGAPAGAAIDPKTGLFTWTPTTHGLYKVSLLVADGGSPPLVTPTTFTVTVKGDSPAVSMPAGGAVVQGSVFRKNGSIAAPAVAGPLTAYVDFGDGSGLQKPVMGQPHAFTLSHAYARPGDYVVTVAAVGSDGSVGRGTTTVTVTAAPAASGRGAWRDAFVGSLYAELLGRSPEPDGLRFWTGAMVTGVRPKTVAVATYTSAEHRAWTSLQNAPPTSPRRSYAHALLAGRVAAGSHAGRPAGPLALARGASGSTQLRARRHQPAGPR